MHYDQNESIEKLKLFYKGRLAVEKFELTDHVYNINHVKDLIKIDKITFWIIDLNKKK